MKYLVFKGAESDFRVMNFQKINKGWTRLAGCLLTAGWMTAGTNAAVSIDGSATVGDGYTTLHVQQNATSGDSRNALVNFRSVQDGDLLNVFLGGVVDGSGNSIILFIDSKAGGVSRITDTQITVVDENDNTEEYYINQFAIDDTEGMTFENGFLPDIAIRIGGGGTGTARRANVNYYDLTAGTFQIVGEAHQANVSYGPISNMRAVWNAVGSLANYGTVADGVEMALSLSALGVAPGSTSVKMMAIHVDGIAYTGSNQTLGSLPNGYPAIDTDINTVNFETIAGTQTISVPITLSGSNPNGDDDSDGLLNGVETNTHIFVSASDTGTDPNDNDSDDDGFLDHAEVLGTSALGFASNPNIANYASIGVSNVPGLGNITPMSVVSTSLTGQYQWQLDYKITTPQLPISGQLNCKFTSIGGSPVVWGGGVEPGVAILSGSDIPVSVVGTGIHRFYFDQIALTYSVGRLTYPDQAAFLTAYGLASNVDSDSDGINNEDEYAANTDPTVADTDGDGYNDLLDQFPLDSSKVDGGYDAWAAVKVPGNPDRGSDADHDGFTNFQEYLFGTSPTVSNGSLFSLQRNGGNLELRWVQKIVVANFVVQESTTLSAASWPVSGVAPVTDTDQSNVPFGYVRKVATVTPNSPHKFYRVRGSE